MVRDQDKGVAGRNGREKCFLDEGIAIQGNQLFSTHWAPLGHTWVTRCCDSWRCWWIDGWRQSVCPGRHLADEWVLHRTVLAVQLAVGENRALLMTIVGRGLT